MKKKWKIITMKRDNSLKNNDSLYCDQIFE